ncbi:MAG: MEKHLA domain-containing protein [Nitrospiraceae bacterium]
MTSPSPEHIATPWRSPALVAWCRLLLDSYRRVTGEDLLVREGTPEAQAEACYLAPFALLSHGNEADPILNYGNRTAQTLWEMKWDDLTRTPSRLTAEAVHREERARFLEEVTRRGCVRDYRGIRISRTGRRFLVEGATVWMVQDGAGRILGQAATFTRWSPLEPVSGAATVS